MTGNDICKGRDSNLPSEVLQGGKRRVTELSDRISEYCEGIARVIQA